MSDARLEHIQRLQFADRTAAEALLLDFVREIFPDLGANAVELRPLAVSLNSFNGFLTLTDGRRLFFKTHVEPDSIVGEYYNTDLLIRAGYPIIRPVYASTEYGRQLLIYDLIDSPSVFDVVHAIDRGERHDLEALADAQRRADDRLLQIYRETLDWQLAEEAARAPVHQLFYHRLGARYAQFYLGQPFALPGGVTRDWETLLTRQWRINGHEYVGTLGQSLQLARQLLHPEQAGWSVVGHGDAHNGNVFFTPGGLVYFDPAFGGRHHPLLDIAKPLFHNVFATWMYHPQEVAATLRIEWHDDGHTVTVTHNHRPSPVRRMFLASKVERVLRPLIRELRRRGAAFDWRTYLKSALLCCPLLTMNLADRERFPPEIGLLGLCYVVEMGLQSRGAALAVHLDSVEA